jgi:hypothetical protein
MKKSILVVACVSLSLAVIISRSWAGPETAAAKEKEAVDKVLKAEKFTPTVAIEGPSNSVWFVASRIFGAKATYEPIAEGWKRYNVPPGLVVNLQSKIENEVGKEK